MALGGGMSCVKYLLFCFNLLFAVTGLIILIVGAKAQISLSPYVELTGENFYISGPIVLIIVGVIVFIVAFFGCCGAFKENHCMIVTGECIIHRPCYLWATIGCDSNHMNPPEKCLEYFRVPFMIHSFSVFLLIIFVAELAVGIAGYMKHQDLEDSIMRNLNATIKEYPNNPDVRKTFDIIQTDLKCCGIYGPGDWTNNSIPIPESCCSAQEIKAGAPVPCDDNNIHKAGCFGKLVDFLRSVALLLGGVGLGIAIIQLLGVIFACCLARSIRSQYETV